jgi:hypothetical protein
VLKQRRHIAGFDHILTLVLCSSIHNRSVAPNGPQLADKDQKFPREPFKLKVATGWSGTSGLGMFLYVCRYAENGHNSVTTAHQRVVEGSITTYDNFFCAKTLLMRAVPHKKVLSNITQIMGGSKNWRRFGSAEGL